MFHKISVPYILRNRSFKRDVTASTAFGMNLYSFYCFNYWTSCNSFNMYDMSSYNGGGVVFRNISKTQTRRLQPMAITEVWAHGF